MRVGKGIMVEGMKNGKGWQKREVKGGKKGKG